MKIVKRNYYDGEGHFIIKPYRVKDLAAIYDVSTKTLRTWIVKAAPTVDKNGGQYYSINDVTKIVQAIGLPQKIVINKAA